MSMMKEKTDAVLEKMLEEVGDKMLSAEPVFENRRLVRFKMDVKPGEILELKYVPFWSEVQLKLPRDVMVLAEYDFHILVDTGKGRLSLNKAAICSKKKPIILCRK